MKISQVYFKKIPKVELHRHLEGSMRVDTLMEIARLHGITLPLQSGLRALVQIQPEEPLNYSVFLSKFQTLRLFYRSPEVIARITREAIEDASLDGIYYLELRFSPFALSRVGGFHIKDIFSWVCEAASQSSVDFQLPTRLIVTINRQEPIEIARQVLQIATEYQSRGVVGVDLAGNEMEYPTIPYLALFTEARAAGLHTTIHAGEWGGADNIREAIEIFQADRISHGVRIMDDPSVIALARERGIVFEVCITSNYQTGIIPALADHPLNRMLMAGLNVTINTDDPSISNITLGNEYQVAVKELGLPKSILGERIMAAIKAAFLPADEKIKLAEHIQSDLRRFTT